MSVPPRHCVSLVRDRKTSSRAFVRLHANSFQKWTLRLSVATLAAGLRAGVAYKRWQMAYAGWTSPALMSATMLLGLAHRASLVLPEVMRMRNLEHGACGTLEREFDEQIELIELLADCEPHCLRHAQDLFALHARQMRERCALLVGALDKVGAVPAAATGYLAYAKAIQDRLQLGPLAWAAYGFIGLCLIAIRMNAVAQWMERASELYERALELQAARLAHSGHQPKQDGGR